MSVKGNEIIVDITTRRKVVAVQSFVLVAAAEIVDDI